MALPTGKLRIVSNTQLDQAEKDKQAIAVTIEDQDVSRLAQYLNNQWALYRHNSTDIHNKCIAALRAYQGKYSPSKLADIKLFGGSAVYSGITSVKCRAATALLRDVFLGVDKSWGVEATPVPELPSNIMATINELVLREAMAVSAAGQSVPKQQIQRRRNELMTAAQKAAKLDASNEAKKADAKLDDVLTEGKFYKAILDFLTDLPIFPYAVIKGPVVQNSTELKWVNGALKLITIPRMYWYRVSPLDIYFAPGASETGDAGIIEHMKISRTDLQNLRGLPGYDTENIDKVLEEYKNGWYLAHSDDNQRADLENRETPTINTDHLLDGLEYQGPIRGDILLDTGFTDKQIPNKNIDYNVTTWWIGRYVIKTHINPTPTRPNQYYVTSYEKIPGSIPGSGITEIIDHIQQVANATLRSLVNNMSISSGPQVAINEDRISPHTDPDSLYPWKRWRFTADIFGSSEKPIDFFQPDSNAAELLAVYGQMSNIADDISAIPKFLQGSEKVGGAARTASGLSMLINNASKMLQTVAANIDRDVIDPLITDLYNIMMLTDKSGLFRGDTKVVVNGVKVATQQETNRLRKLEFLQLTTNEIDAQIVGPEGRAVILRDIAEDLGMKGANIVPEIQTNSLSPQAPAPGQPQAPAEAGARPAEAVEGITQAQRLS